MHILMEKQFSQIFLGFVFFIFFGGWGGGGGGKSPRFSTVFWLLRNKVIFNCPNLSWYHEFFDPTHKILFVIVSASNERFNEHT